MPTYRRAGFIVLIVFLVVGIAIGGYFAFRRTVIADLRESSINAAALSPVEYGEVLFQTRVCTSCHTLDTARSIGDEGPDLSGIGGRDTADYIRQSIAEPNAVIADNCPAGMCQSGVMPPFGQILTDEQIDALTAYLIAQQ